MAGNCRLVGKPHRASISGMRRASCIIVVAFATFSTFSTGCSSNGATVHDKSAHAPCDRRIDIWEPNSPGICCVYTEIGERRVTCSGFSLSECDAQLVHWACQLGADAVVADPPVQGAVHNKWQWGKASRTGRAIRFGADPLVKASN